VDSYICGLLRGHRSGDRRHSESSLFAVNPDLNGDRVRNSWPLLKTCIPSFFRKGRGLRPGILIYVVMTAGAAVGSTGALRRRIAAEIRVMIRPTGRGSMKV